MGDPAADPVEPALPGLRAGAAEAGARPEHAKLGPGAQAGGAAVALAALGVVFGDIGTSPLYAFRESIDAVPAGEPVDTAVLGVASLVFWALVIVVSVKYLLLVMRADNRGEGGILALAAVLFPSGRGTARRRLPVLVLLAIAGCGLLFGDGLITPVISVLSAVEGLEVAVSGVEPWVVPITVVILLALFAVQRFGTHRIGAVFGPVMLLWFGAIGVFGAVSVAGSPGVLRALSPHYAAALLIDGGPAAFWVLGSVVLAVTGAEALYADMGHFGRSPIRRAWYVVVLPALVLSYLGQAALLLSGPAENPFFEVVPSALVVPMVVLATAATVIASQALITGVFSLTHQAVRLGYLPRVNVRHTSAGTEGQIYLPSVNVVLCIACVVLAVAFQTSGALAAAYGIAVAGTMMITTVLIFAVARTRWGWSLPRTMAVMVPLGLVDAAFLVGNARKIHEGGWLPLLVGAVTFAAMSVWWYGRRRLEARLAGSVAPEADFLAGLDGPVVVRPPGAGVFLAVSPAGIPVALQHHVRRVHAAPERLVLLSILSDSRPWVVGDRLLEIHDLGHGVVRVIARIGFMQVVDVPRLVRESAARGLDVDEADVTYLVGRYSAAAARAAVPLRRLPAALFAAMYRNAGSATRYFGLPPERTVEIGMSFEV